MSGAAIPGPPAATSPDDHPLNQTSAVGGVVVPGALPAVPGGPGWQEASLAGLLCLVIAVTAVGNTLVIAAVLTTRRLRTVTNCFVMSLAVADWLVGIFVMPPAVAVHLMGSWELGSALCDIWISLDVLLCTASILSLCAISVDRYLAVTRPLTYSRRRRSKRLALGMILVVWLAALAITCPPILGWYEPGRRAGRECRYNQNEGYVVFSAVGSFFLPMCVMLYVYCRISCVVAQRHDRLAHLDTRTSRGAAGERADRKATSGNASKKNRHASREDSDLDRISSEYEATPTPAPNPSPHPGHHHAQSHPSTPRSLRRPLTYSFTADRHLDASTRVSSFRRETKTAQTLSIVVGGFVACWLPFFVYYLLTPFLPEAAISKVAMGYLTWLGWINSAINPFIYAFYSPDFRLAFWRLTLRRCARGNKRAAVALQHK